MQQLAIYQFIWWLFLGFFSQVCFVKQYKKTVRLVDIAADDGAAAAGQTQVQVVH